MALRRRSGFTLIELLVVIAIIAILAAMLFPVFARARESARKIQCLANVKNIATAVQMYLTDYDRFPARPNHDADLLDFFATAPGGRDHEGDCCNHACHANPYGRWPVILEEYVKNRDVWRCPSAKMSFGPQVIIPQYTSPWWRYLEQTQGMWGTGTPAPICTVAYPTGWGGTVTDSIGQQQSSGLGAQGTDATNAAELTLGLNSQHPELKTSQIEDPSWFVVGGDALAYPGQISTPDRDLMFGVCGANYYIPENTCAMNPDCGGTEWCGLTDDQVSQWSDPSFRSRYTRHLGGSNVAFADGHASWFSAEAFLAQAPYCDCACPTQHIIKDGRQVAGLCPNP